MNKSNLAIALRGLAMGMAEVVPGVSGGTIAFITGIYERLINAIKSISSVPVGVWKDKGFKAFWTFIDGYFLIALITGMMGGIVIGVLGISYLLENYPPLVWGFFFGLIIASVVYIGRQVDRWSMKEIGFLIAGAIIAYGITIVSPAEGSENLLFVFISGAIAVSALILPGISGSFILLLLGMYPIILHSAENVVSDRSASSALLLIVFIVGCIVGLFLFSNILSWTFKNYRYPTLALLTGFMLGSLNKIWPWRNPTAWIDKSSGAKVTAIDQNNLENYRLVSEVNVAPTDYLGNPMFWPVILSFVAGLGLVYLFAKMDRA